MRTKTLAYVLSLSTLVGLAACATDASEDVSTGTDALSSTSLSCTYGSASFTVTRNAASALVGALDVSGHHLTYTCHAATDGSSTLVCDEDPQTAHTGTWTFVVTKSGATYTATLERGGTSADIPFACSLSTTVVDAGPAPVDAGPGPGDDASVEPVDAGPGPTVASYTEVAPLIASACGGCHHGSFGTLDKVKASKTRMLGMITSGRMPRGNPSWKSSADGLEVIDFLQNSPELQ